jgi:hypothetical protein
MAWDETTEARLVFSCETRQQPFITILASNLLCNRIHKHLVNEDILRRRLHNLAAELPQDAQSCKPHHIKSHEGA